MQQAHSRALPLTQVMAAWCRTNDPSRPVQYESGGGAACTDIICPMYPPLRTIGPLATSVRAQCAPSSAFEVAPTRIWPRHKHTQELRYAPCRARRVTSHPGATPLTFDHTRRAPPGPRATPRDCTKCVGPLTPVRLPVCTSAH